MRSTATLYRQVPTADSMGGQSTVHTLIGRLPCRRRQPIVSAEGENAQADTAGVTETVYFMPGVDVRRNDELHIDGDVLDVHAVYTPSAPVYLRADCLSRQR